MEEKIKVEEIDEETVGELASGILLDAIIDLLVKKKIISQKDITKQLEENRGKIEEFVKSNPSLIEGLKDEIKLKREHKMDMGSYIG